MATKQARGTKRTCQSSECDARFYDLNRSPIVCPICGTVYELASSPLVAAAASEDRGSRRGRKLDFADKPASKETEDGDEELEIEDSEDGEDEAISADEDETFLEEEEEGGDVSNIIGGPVKEGDEER